MTRFDPQSGDGEILSQSGDGEILLLLCKTKEHLRLRVTVRPCTGISHSE